MPKRDRNHELETLSQRAFEAAMLPSVVVRPISDDYGIDREVEVFVDGRTTGLTFKVQLKGTDKSGSSRRVKRTSLEYWRSLDVPVLIVSFEAPSEVLRGRWVHSIGFDEPDRGAETVTVHMDPDIGFDAVTAESLAADLELIREVKSGRFPVPTPVHVAADADAQISAPQLLAATLALSRRTRTPMRAAQRDEAGIIVVVERSRVSVALPLRIGSASIHLSGRAQTHELSSLAEMVVVLAAVAASTVNAGQARLWLSAAGSSGDWWGMDELHERLLPLLDHPEMADQLLEIFAGLAIRDEPAAMIYAMPLMDRVRDANETTFAGAASSLRAHLLGHKDEARLAFNLAGMYRMRGAHSEAAELYELARVKSHRYREDPLLLRYLGASQWEMGNYATSATTYRQSLELGFDPFELLPLIADSLMLAGDYGDARAALQDWQPQGVSEDRAGLLRLVMLDHLIDHVGVEQQQRLHYDEDAARNAFEAATEPDLDDDQIRAVLRDFDALHPAPWRALVKARTEDLTFADALVLAWAHNNVARAWVLALAAALINDEPEDLVRAVVAQARFHCRDEFYTATLQFAELQDEEFGGYLRELISAAYSSEFVPFQNRVRMIGKGSKKGKGWIVDEEFFPTSPDKGW